MNKAAPNDEEAIMTMRTTAPMTKILLPMTLLPARQPWTRLLSDIASLDEAGLDETAPGKAAADEAASRTRTLPGRRLLWQGHSRRLLQLLRTALTDCSHSSRRLL